MVQEGGVLISHQEGPGNMGMSVECMCPGLSLG